MTKVQVYLGTCVLDQCRKKRRLLYSTDFTDSVKVVATTSLRRAVVNAFVPYIIDYRRTSHARMIALNSANYREYKMIV